MKKGFTLIEVLAVVVILGIIIALVIPIVNKTIDNSRLQSELAQEKIIINAAKKYIIDNDIYVDNNICITLSELKSNGYLKNQSIEDLTNKESLNDYCVNVTWSNNDYEYELIKQ